MSWRSKVPDRLTAYKESSQPFPVSDSTESVLKVPCLDDLSERLNKRDMEERLLSALLKVYFLSHSNL